MNTIIAKAGVDDDRMYEQAAEILKRGGLVAFPTETVYGLGGDALNPDASHFFGFKQLSQFPQFSSRYSSPK
mgnify:CR=1 FL=1